MNWCDDFTFHRLHSDDSPRSRWGDGRSRTLLQVSLSTHEPPMLHHPKLLTSRNISTKMCLCTSELRRRKELHEPSPVLYFPPPLTGYHFLLHHIHSSHFHTFSSTSPLIPHLHNPNPTTIIPLHPLPPIQLFR